MKQNSNARYCQKVENDKEKYTAIYEGLHKNVNIIIRHNLQKTPFWLKILEFYKKIEYSMFILKNRDIITCDTCKVLFCASKLRFVFRFIRRYFLITVIDNSAAVLSRNYNRFVLAFSCLFGIVSGYVGFLFLGDEILSMICNLCTAYFSVWSMVCAIVSPWLLTLFAFHIGSPVLIYMLSFQESASISLITSCLCCVYSSYGRFISWILLLGKRLSILFLYLSWQYYFSDKAKYTFRVLGIGFLLILPVIAIQYQFAAPLLMHLIKIQKG